MGAKDLKREGIVRLEGIVAGRARFRKYLIFDTLNLVPTGLLATTLVAAFFPSLQPGDAAYTFWFGLLYLGFFFPIVTLFTILTTWYLRKFQRIPRSLRENSLLTLRNLQVPADIGNFPLKVT